MMDSIKIKIHSEVDVITNSSTTIYTRVRNGGIETIKSVVDTMLKIAKSDLIADDLFTFEIVKEDISDMLIDMILDEGIASAYYETEISWRTPEWREKCKVVYDKIESGEYPKPNFWEYGYLDKSSIGSSIKVTPKIKDKDIELVGDLLSNLETLFISSEREN